MKKELKKLAVLVSGNGTTLEYIINAIEQKELDSTINIVISNNLDAYAITRAKKHNINTYILKDTNDENELYSVLKNANIDLVVLAGYLKLIPKKVINNFVIINTHPALLPKYGGKGMYGMNVHEAVYKNRENITGATIHFVNEEYDKGSIISQTKVLINENDTPESICKNVQKSEKIEIVKVLKKFSEGLIDIG